MDHLALPVNLVQTPFEVPFLCKDVVYSPPFLTYPERSGWSKEQLISPAKYGQTGEAVDAFLQAWLFFGLMKTIFGPAFHPHHFIRQGSATGTLIVTSEPLPRMWLGFAATSGSMASEELLAHRRTAETNINMARSILQAQLYQPDELAVQEGSMAMNDTLVTLSIQFLSRYLSSRLRLTQPFLLPFRFERGFIENSMLQEGWCPSNVAKLSSQLTPENLYLLRHMDRPDPHLDHLGCNTGECVAYRVRPGTYKTKHWQHRSCPFVGASSDLLFDVLKDRQIPLIENRHYDAQDTIDLLPSGHASKYVAISHVWSHGLGNNDDNSLPLCQLTRLNKLVDGLYQGDAKKVPYWIDTISCPLTPEEATDLAIVNMRKTYIEADKVLVLDAYLESTSAQPMTTIEILLRIICSSWTRRLWTLQEGALAQQLYFQFADGAINVDDACQDLADADTYDEWEDIGYCFVELRHMWEKGKQIPGADLMYMLSRSIRHRSTSVPADEALCLGTLAGVRMEKIAQAPPEERMKRFWSLFPSVSHLVVFWTGERLKIPGFRWAPATFLGQGHYKFDLSSRDLQALQNTPLARLSDRGLVVQAPGILLGQWRAPVSSHFWVVDEKDNWYYVDLELDHKLTSSKQPVRLEPRSPLDNSTRSELALILMPTVNDDSATTKDAEVVLRNRMGILVLTSGEPFSDFQSIILANVLVVPSTNNIPVNDPGLVRVQNLARKARNLGMARVKHTPELLNVQTGGFHSMQQDISVSSCTEEHRDVIIWDKHGWTSVDRGHHFCFEGVSVSQKQSWELV